MSILPITSVEPKHSPADAASAAAGAAVSAASATHTETTADRPDRFLTGLNGQVIVEFLGTSGAGKTTLHVALLRELRRRGYSVLTPADMKQLVAGRTLAGRLALTMPWARLQVSLLARLVGRRLLTGGHAFRSRHAALLRHIAEAQQRRPAAAGAERRQVLPMFLEWGAGYMSLRRLARPGEILLFDEAFAHRVVQFFVSDVEAPDLTGVAAYLDLIPPPDVLVWVDAPVSACAARVRARGLWWHSRHFSDGQLATFLQHAQVVTRFAAAEARRRGWTVLEVSNDGAPDETVDCLLTRVGIL